MVRNNFVSWSSTLPATSDERPPFRAPNGAEDETIFDLERPGRSNSTGATVQGVLTHLHFGSAIEANVVPEAQTWK